MSESRPQNFKNHGRLDPLFHMVLLLVLFLNLIFAILHLWHRRDLYTAWLLVLSLAVFIPYAKLRTYPMKVQDRVIRLEERLRLLALAPAEWHSQIARLSEDQLIALRFASDEELVRLARQALEENLTRKQIKQRIQNWRPDYWRV